MLPHARYLKVMCHLSSRWRGKQQQPCSNEGVHRIVRNTTWWLSGGWHLCVIPTARPELWLAMGVEDRLELASTSQVRSVFFLMGPKSGWKKERLCDRLWFESHKSEVQFQCILRADFADGEQKRSLLNDPGTKILFKNESRLMKDLGILHYTGQPVHFSLWIGLNGEPGFPFHPIYPIQESQLSIHLSMSNITYLSGSWESWTQS